MNFRAAEPRGIKRATAELTDSFHLDFWHSFLAFLRFRVRRPCWCNIRLTKMPRPIIAFLLPAFAWRFLWRWYFLSPALFLSDCRLELTEPNCRWHVVAIGSYFQKLYFITQGNSSAYFFEFLIYLQRNNCFSIFCRTYYMINQNANIVFLTNDLAHPSSIFRSRATGN